MADASTQVDFYHLTQTPVERALPRIAGKVLEAGGRLLIVSGDEAQREALDRALWEQPADGFLPHGAAGGAHDSHQPVLIAEGCNAVNGAKMVALADGKWRDEALGFERAFLFFDDAGRAAAREAWAALAAREDVEPRYHAQEEGRWVRKR